ncbi:MAG: efflux RND transporter periplasmic adaptor subunit [Clostridia bacterium]|jgi:HlyD family secretion protein|nr:efflux RND transporter periplasmic adaptor subunit [Clostridia bacterium]
MKRKWKVMLGALVAIAVLGFIFFENTKAMEASMLEAQPRTIATAFKEEGKVVPEVEHHVYSLYNGVIIDLAVEEGQQVNKGQLLAVLDSKELDFQIRQLQAQLTSLRGEQEKAHQEPYQALIRSQELQVEQAQQNLATFETNLGRIEQLYHAGAATKKDFEDAANMVESAKINLELQQAALSLLFETHSPAGGTEEFYMGRIEVLKAQIDMLQFQKERHTITAPADGIVASLAAKKGAAVSPQSPMMHIFQQSSYLVEVYLLTADVPSVSRSMNVKLIQDRKGEEIIFFGTITKIAPTAVETVSALGLAEQRVKVTVETEFPKNLQLFPGYKLDVEFTLDQRENVLVVPKTTLFPYKNGEALWVVKEGIAEVQPVETGFTNGRDVVISGGLTAGDLVILNPQLEGLKEGKKIVSQ